MFVSQVEQVTGSISKDSVYVMFEMWGDRKESRILMRDWSSVEKSQDFVKV